MPKSKVQGKYTKKAEQTRACKTLEEGWCPMINNSILFETFLSIGYTNLSTYNITCWHHNTTRVFFFFFVITCWVHSNLLRELARFQFLSRKSWEIGLLFGNWNHGIFYLYINTYKYFLYVYVFEQIIRTAKDI